MEAEKEKLENSLRTQTREKDNRSRTSDSPPAASPAEGSLDSASSVINALGSFVTHFEPHGNEVRWDANHVVFLGDADPHVLRRWLQHGRYIVELHDRDPKDLPDGVVCPHGEARFSFAQLLPNNSMAQHFKSVRLRGDVLPYRGNIKVRFNKTKSGGIPVEDLLTGDTAAILKNFTSSNERREFTPDYILAGTCIVIQVDMLEPLEPAKVMRERRED